MEAHGHQWELAPLELLEPLLVGWGHREEPVASLEHVSALSRAVKARPSQCGDGRLLVRLQGLPYHET